jgi:hypothetical protein
MMVINKNNTIFTECPSCHCMMILRNGKFGKYFDCVCGLIHRVHQDNNQLLGIPADSQTRKLRTRAHQAFDSWWKRIGIKRKEAYSRLARILGLPQKETHIGRFNEEICERVIELFGTINEEFN